MQFEPEVTILADSISPKGIRLTTFQLKYWRAVHSEMMTHRVFSRCAQSSRATPIEKTFENIKNGAWGPAKWTKNCKGMVAQEELNAEHIPYANLTWDLAAQNMITIAQGFVNMGIHKQIVNRLLEPFNSINVVVSSTCWNNFWKLRQAHDADPSIKILADKMHEVFDQHEPEKLDYGQWHLPHIQEEDWNLVKEYQKNTDSPKNFSTLMYLCRVSAARCARVSYKAFDGTTSIEQDLNLFNRLVQDGHMTPLEHVAMADDGKFPEEYGNFIGWRQLRKMMPNEFIPG